MYLHFGRVREQKLSESMYQSARANCYIESKDIMHLELGHIKVYFLMVCGNVLSYLSIIKPLDFRKKPRVLLDRRILCSRVNPIQTGLFRGSSNWGGGRKQPAAVTK